MSDVKNLSSTDAVKKLKELAESADICQFVTNLSTLPLSARPMSTSGVDEEGNIWFMSKEGSDKNLDIERDDQVQLFYSNNGSAEYLSVYGHAEISRDRAKIEELWSPLNKVWFTEGKDDPQITLIKVVPADIYYWDTKNNKLVSLLKMAASLVTGKTKDDGVRGKLKVH